MKYPWLPYVIVVIVAAAAGAAIAGLPGDQPVDATIVVTETTPASSSTAVATTVPATTAPPATDPPATTTTVGPTTTTTTTTVPDLPDRASLSVVVANGASIPDLASTTAEALEFAFDYVDVSTANGSEIVDVTVIYYVDGFEGSASRLAVDLSLEPTAIAPIAGAPSVNIDLDDAQLLGYLGRDAG